MRPLLLLTIVFTIGANCEKEVEKVSVVTPRDSYLDAYTFSHSESGPVSTVKTDREYSEPYPYPAPQPQYGVPSGPGPNYGAPAPNYGPPAPAYGPPAPQYGPPAPQYVPSAPAYGPPPAPIYGPPAHSFYGMPHGMLSIFDKIKLKLDLFTIGKILLKLVIFKKIVSLIAILCLLLFIPSLKHKEESSSEDDSMRKFKSYDYTGDEKLNNITHFVLEAIDNFSNKQKKSVECDSVYCQTQNVLKRINKKMTYKKLAKMYSKEIK